MELFKKSLVIIAGVTFTFAGLTAMNNDAANHLVNNDAANHRVVDAQEYFEFEDFMRDLRQDELNNLRANLTKTQFNRVVRYLQDTRTTVSDLVSGYVQSLNNLTAENRAQVIRYIKVTGMSAASLATEYLAYCTLPTTTAFGPVVFGATTIVAGSTMTFGAWLAYKAYQHFAPQVPAQADAAQAAQAVVAAPVVETEGVLARAGHLIAVATKKLGNGTKACVDGVKAYLNRNKAKAS